jgi:endonuclease YncB( thermonuclease family)
LAFIEEASFVAQKAGLGIWSGPKPERRSLKPAAKSTTE